MRRVRQLAELTQAGRERYVDLLRALAITLVVLGHWTDTVIVYDRSGHLTGYSALSELRGRPAVGEACAARVAAWQRRH